jgi:hypothetical protein
MSAIREQKKDTSEYSASKAPDTREHGEETTSEPDTRLEPGGPLGTPEPTGMSALDPEDVPALDPGTVTPRPR